VLGALGCWTAQAAQQAAPAPGTGGARFSHSSSPDARSGGVQAESHCPVAPGPVYARIGETTLPYREFAASLSGSVLRHVSLAHGAPAQVPIAGPWLGRAIEAGALLVSGLGSDAIAWVPSVDPAAHRPAILLTAVGRSPGQWQSQPHLHSATASVAGAGAPLSTHRAAYRQGLLAALAELEAAGVTLFAVSAPGAVPLPPLPRAVESNVREAIASVLAVCAALDRARESVHSTSAGAAAKQRLLDVVSETGELLRLARTYLDALWDEAIAASAQR